VNRNRKSVKGMISFAAAFGGEQVLHPYNLQGALWQVLANKGSTGVDGMKTSELTDIFRREKMNIISEWKFRKGMVRPDF
jgi:hypothetical protein